MIRTLLLLALLLTGLSSWLPAAAQMLPNDATPDTMLPPPSEIRMPLIFGESHSYVECPQSSNNLYEAIPILKSPRSPKTPPHMDPDLNLLMRGYKPAIAPLTLIAINGPTDDDAPQLAHLFRPVRVPALSVVYQIHDWNWACCPGGKKGELIQEPEVTLVRMVTTPGETLYPPRRNANFGDDFIALVLYAEEFRLTIVYVREDTPAHGYVIHFEELCVDPTLLALYRQMHRDGRTRLPALRRSDPIGIAFGEGLLVAVRDSGSFMDPRSAKDWWQDQVRALLAAQAAP